MAVLLTILKIIGIILLCLLCLVLLLLCTVLFVPIRYCVKGNRKEPENTPVSIQLKISWLLHLLKVHYHYPKPGYFIIRLFGIKVLTTNPDKPVKKDKKSKKKKQDTENLTEQATANNTEQVAADTAEQDMAITIEQPAADTTEKNPEAATSGFMDNPTENFDDTETSIEDCEETPTLKKFIQKLIDIIRNIRYTIQKIYDKIKEVIRNINYYIEILKSESFQNAFLYSKNELFKLITKLLPGKINANLLVGTGDPATTGNILAIHGILYPYIGNHVFITPDFENKVLEGDFLLKGKVTIFRVLLTALRIYFHKDIRKLLKELKKGGNING